MELTVGKRDKLIGLLSSEYIIPEEYIDCVKVAIKQYATKNYSDETIDNMVRTPQSLSKGLSLLRESNGKNNLSLFRGIISEWLVCAEYNALKNKGTVIMTIINPDSSSKADLLHIIDTGNGFKAVPGSDVKSGGSTYVFNQWKKIVHNRYEIPMVDIDGILTTEEGLKQLTKKQHAELEELYQQYPNKRPVTSSWDVNDINRVLADYLKFVEFGTLPSMESSRTIKDIKVSEIKSKLYSGEFSNHQEYSWEIYASETRRIMNSKEVIDEGRELDIPSEINTKDDANNVYQAFSSVNQLSQPKFVDSVKIKVSNGFNWAKKVGKGAWNWVIEHPQETVTIVTTTAIVANAVAAINSVSNNVDATSSEVEIEGNDDYELTDIDYQYNNVGDSVTIVEGIEEELNTHHASKHTRNLPEGQKASPEKIRTAEENGFKLEENQTWVDDY